MKGKRKNLNRIENEEMRDGSGTAQVSSSQRSQLAGQLIANLVRQDADLLNLFVGSTTLSDVQIEQRGPVWKALLEFGTSPKWYRYFLCSMTVSEGIRWGYLCNSIEVRDSQAERKNPAMRRMTKDELYAAMQIARDMLI